MQKYQCVMIAQLKAHHAKSPEIEPRQNPHFVIDLFKRWHLVH